MALRQRDRASLKFAESIRATALFGVGLRAQRVRVASKALIDLNRVSGVAEFAQRNHQTLAVVRLGMELISFSFCLVAVGQQFGGSGSLVEVFSRREQIQLARIALELTMPTIFLRGPCR